jgi:hypothetical protein
MTRPIIIERRERDLGYLKLKVIERSRSCRV